MNDRDITKKEFDFDYKNSKWNSCKVRDNNDKTKTYTIVLSQKELNNKNNITLEKFYNLFVDFASEMRDFKNDVNTRLDNVESRLDRIWKIWNLKPKNMDEI